ncbi:MAG TPA: MarR family transcriptional regulator [Bacteroidetes bacterium]|nr:MarR family transcriptional regulator [Bacteroidota bacterium]
MLSIGEEIKQSHFRSEHQKSILNILLTANTIYASNSRFFKTYGLSPEQYNVLRIVRGNHPTPCTVLSIQERMLDKMSNASRLVDKLESKGLLLRIQCKEDRRQVSITITQKGLGILEEIAEPFESLESSLNCVSDPELIRFNEILDIIRNVYRDALINS